MHVSKEITKESLKVPILMLKGQDVDGLQTLLDGVLEDKKDKSATGFLEKENYQKTQVFDVLISLLTLAGTSFCIFAVILWVKI